MTAEWDEAGFQARLATTASSIGATLDGLLPVVEGGAATLAAAMHHAAASPGKRLRGFLSVSVATTFGVDAVQALRVAASVECLHAYSLIHDDLPCMDDDDLRRGLPTVHVKWDEATAVLAGDALQTLAFEILADARTHPDGEVRAALCLALARASGAQGMVGGQAMDIAAESATKPLELAEIRALQAGKTGALICFAAVAGAILAQATPQHISAIRGYAEKLGEAFQVQDDILDVSGQADQTGKAVGKDQAAGKATFVSLLGLDGARVRARDLVRSAIADLDAGGLDMPDLRNAAWFSISRMV